MGKTGKRILEYLGIAVLAVLAVFALAVLALLILAWYDADLGTRSLVLVIVESAVIIGAIAILAGNRKKKGE